ncbi:MAG: protein kinase [Clostridia bacterium]|nr:protein kinase [Clostridia bacterium]
MSNSLNPVFGEWYTDKQIGTGTDGKVFSIYREKYDGTKEKSILKIIRLGENRNERKTFNLNENEDVYEEEYDGEYEKIIRSIKKNIRSVRKSDDGKYFVRYEDLELRKASDGKGKLILIKLEECRSLTDILKELSFTLEETMRLGINICNSLIKCRSFGYIYPNLKPENILFDRSGRCKLGDFGTFSCLEPSKTSIAYKRTQYFMAPEVIRTGNVNCTVDTYSLGLILYMLTNRNRLPFMEPYPQNVTINSYNTATQMRVSGNEISRPALASDELWKIIRKACAFNINERYFTPNQMLSDLKNALANKPFEEAVYDEVYSVADIDTENSGEEIIIPEIEQTAEETKEEVTPVLSLKEEITIPEISPIYKNEAPKKKKRAVRYPQLPEIKKKKTGDIDAIKRMMIIAAVGLVLLILLIASLVMKISDGSPESTAVMINDILVFAENYGGVFLYGC